MFSLNAKPHFVIITNNNFLMDARNIGTTQYVFFVCAEMKYTSISTADVVYCGTIFVFLAFLFSFPDIRKITVFAVFTLCIEELFIPIG